MLKESKLRRSMDNYYNLSGNNPRIDNLRVLIDNNYVFSLFKKIEQAKIDISNWDESAIEFIKESINIHEPFKPAEFETIIVKYTTEIELYIVNLLHSVGYKAENIDSVFITGGSSLVVPIRNILYKLFGKEKIRLGDTFNSVAFGLSLSAS